MKRYGAIVGVSQNKVSAYNRRHAAVRPDMLSRIARSNVRTHSISLHKMPDGKHCLSRYFEHTCDDFKADPAAMDDDRRHRKSFTASRRLRRDVAALSNHPFKRS